MKSHFQRSTASDSVSGRRTALRTRRDWPALLTSGALLGAILAGMEMAGVLAAEPPAADAAVLETADPEAAKAPLADGSPFDDPTEPFVPLRPRSSAEQDHIRALALFAAGRVAEQKQDYAEALKKYQRAYRLDPNAVAALREIVPLAFNLGRQEEGVRYAVILAERDPADANLLRRLAMYLAEGGDSQRALRLYENAQRLEAKSAAQPTANTVLLSMEMGRLYFLNKNFAKAAEHFARVADALADPKKYDLPDEVQKALRNQESLTYQLFGEAFLEAGRIQDAQAAFDKVQQLKADDSLQLYNQARIEAKRQQPAQALDKLESYLEQKFSRQGTGPYELYATLLAELGLEDQLVERLERHRESDAENLPLSYFLAERYRESGMVERARPILEQLIREREKRPPLEAVRSLADILRQQQEPAALLKLLGDTVGRAATLSPLGDAADALVNDRSLAEALVAEAEKHLPNEAQTETQPEALDFGVWMAAALVAARLEEFERADALLAAALAAEGAKPGEVLVTWGLEQFSASQYERAARAFERVLEESKDPNPAVMFYLAGALEMAGRTDDALACARQAAALKPDSARFASRIAWIEFHAKRLDDARQSYLELLEQFDKDHESPETRESMRDARLVLSNIAAMQDDLDQAEEWLEQVLDEFPEDTGALNDLGYLWADADKHLERALAMIEAAVADDPQNMAYRDSLGWALFRLGRYREAVAELKVAAAVPDADGVIYDHLAEAQLAHGDTAAAIETWQRAVEAYERDGELEKVPAIREKIKRAQAGDGKEIAASEK